jgi:two-component system response regulator NreC
MTETTVLIVDDHAVLRSGLRMLLEAQPDMSVVGEAGDALGGLDLARSLQPDIVLLDVTMPGQGGLDTLPALRRSAPSSRVLVLTMHDDEGYLRRALQSGAAGYVLKKAADSELIAAIRAVARGEMYVHPALTSSLLRDFLPESAPPTTDPWLGLSEREREVLTLVALGHTSAEIGERLSLSAKTVETYRARGMDKLGLRSRAALVRFALSRGLLTDDDGPR